MKVMYSTGFDYDYIVINNDLESCFNQIEKIIESYKKKNCHLFNSFLLIIFGYFKK